MVRIGRLATVPFSLVSNRLVVRLTPSLPRSSHPKLFAGGSVEPSLEITHHLRC